VLRPCDHRCSGRRSSGGSFYERSGTANLPRTSARTSIRDDHEYLGIPDDEEEAPAARAGSTARKSGFLNRFRSSRPASASQQDAVQRRGKLLLSQFSRIRVTPCAGLSYISPFEPVLNEGARFALFGIFAVFSCPCRKKNCSCHKTVYFEPPDFASLQKGIHGHAEGCSSVGRQVPTRVAAIACSLSDRLA
jgi:hypothetical protein